MEQNNACGSRVAQSKASSTVNLPERSAPFICAQIFSNSTLAPPVSSRSRDLSGDCQRLDLSKECNLSGTGGRPTKHTWEINSANRQTRVSHTAIRRRVVFGKTSHVIREEKCERGCICEITVPHK
jgi:hypothetical protein